jgi:ArsR family transcriptional regulator
MHPDHCPEKHEHPLLDEMVPLSDETYREAASIFRALGEEGRLKTLVLISQRERCVTEIANLMGENIAAVSQRLKCLRGERIVSSRRQGKHIYYALADQHVVDLIQNGLAHAQEDR